MKSFESRHLAQQPITQNLLQTVRLLGEYKGKELLFKNQIPQALETLRQTAAIQSTESSNRIEGITAPHKRLLDLVADKTTPQDRSEQEIAGYRDVLATIHSNHEAIHLTTGIVLQFHRDLYRYGAAEGGHWKSMDNAITERLPDGTQRVRFQPVSTFDTSRYMEDLLREFTESWQTGEVEKLLVIPAFVLDFLCIHPFRDGNGRMARLLTLLLLYQAGYEVGRFVSLERIIENSKESYYDALYRSSQGWHEGHHDLLPFTEYLLGTFVAAYREFESRVGTLTSARGAKTSLVEEAIARLPDGFRMADVERLCPSVTRDMIRVVLRKLKQEGAVWSEGAGVTAVWRKRPGG